MTGSALRAVLATSLVVAFACAERESAVPAPAATQAPATTDVPDAPTTEVLVPIGLASGLAACDLLNADDLEAITGTEFAEGQVTASQPNFSRCSWVPTDAPEGGISLAIQSPGWETTWQNYLGHPATAAVEGVGEAALVNPELLDFVFRKSDHVFIVHFGRPEDGVHVRAWGEAVAAKVLPKV